MNWNAFLADAAAPATTPVATPTPAPVSPSNPPPPQTPSLIIPLVLFGLVIYFMLFRPQQQRQKQMAKLMSSLKAGDKVVTSSGIVGVIITVKDNTVTLRSADTKLEVTKSSITEIRESGDATPSSPS